MPRKKIDPLQAAVSLYMSLHSSAGENVLSSLLAASLNECPDFREQFFTEITKKKPLTTVDYDSLYAEGNVRYGEVIVGAGNERVDVYFSEKSGQEKKYTRPRIFIEVKLDSLGGDRNKYQTFVDANWRKWDFQFVLVCFLYKGHVEKRVKSRTKPPLGKQREWWEFYRFVERHKCCSFITWEEIHDLLKNYTSSKRGALQILKWYLEIDIRAGVKEYWAPRVSLCRSDSGRSILRDEVVQTIQWQARRFGIGVRKNPKGGTASIKKMSLVEVDGTYEIRYGKREDTDSDDILVDISSVHRRRRQPVCIRCGPRCTARLCGNLDVIEKAFKATV